VSVTGATRVDGGLAVVRVIDEPDDEDPALDAGEEGTGPEQALMAMARHTQDQVFIAPLLLGKAYAGSGAVA
jgi:hypothetical protein